MPSENIPISQLTEATEVLDSDFLAIDNGTTTKKISVENFNATGTASAQAAAEAAAASATAASESATAALGYKNTVESALNDASTIVSNAQTYANSAESSKNDASGYASAASTSASQAATSASQAASYATGVQEYATEAKSWAQGGTGTRVDEETTNCAYYANAAHTSETNASTSETNAATSESNAATSATAAAASEASVETNALKAEGYAVGTQNGTAAESGEPYYQDNAKYYKEQAADSATYADGAATIADTKAGQALLSASEAKESEEDSEAWAWGKIDGVDVPATHPAYHNNAKYWADAASGAAGGGVTSFNGRSGIVSPASGDYDASMVSYNGSISTANQVADALDTVMSAVEDLASNLPFVTPKDYGAKGDGVTDDTAAIVAAEAAANTGSKVLLFPSGIYMVQPGVITCHSGMTWIGEEKKSIIIVDPSSTDNDKAIVKIGTVNVADSGNDVAIIGLTFRGSETHGDDQSGISIMDISYGKNILIRNCVFQNNKYTAIRLIRTSNIKVFDCDFEATDCGVVSLGSYPSNDVVVKRCHFTGLSSLNSFTNYSSECVTVGNNAQSDACERWTVEDCIFEHKHTNGVSFTTSESPLTNKIHTKDSVIRNCTFRGMLGAVYIGNSENISVDGIFVDDTPKEFSSSEMHRVIMIEYSKHITVRNVTSKCTELYQAAIRLHSGDDDILIDGIDAYNVHRSSNEAFAYLSGNNITIKNVVIHPVSTFTTAYISCLALTNSYVDVPGNVAEGLVTKYWRNSAGSNVTNNIFVVHTEDATNRTWEGVSTSTADTNKWILVGNGEKNTTNLNQVNQYSLPKMLIVSPTNSSQLDTIGNLTDFTLMQEGYEFFIAFKSSTYANGKSASFNKTGNIIPIDQPFVFSNDYKVVCRFVQKNAKWVEVDRVLEYYEGANVDAYGSLAWSALTGKPFSSIGSGLTVSSDTLSADVQSVTVDSTGTASSSAVSYQRVGVNGSYTEINGTKYMEQTQPVNTSSDTTYTFTNAAITANSVIDVYASEFGINPSNVAVSSGSCVVTIPKQSSAISLGIRIYIK